MSVNNELHEGKESARLIIIESESLRCPICKSEKCISSDQYYCYTCKDCGTCFGCL